MEWIFYVMRCQDDTLYAGVTTDLLRRMRQHNHGRGAKYMRPAKRRPAVAVMRFGMSSKSAALRAECRFKRWTREEKQDFIYGWLMMESLKG